MKKLLVLFCLVPLLSGCWDEVLYKEVTIVPLMGMDQEEEDEMKMFFSFPTIEEESISYHVTEGKGESMRSARNDAYLHSNEILDVSQVETFLISESVAENHLYEKINPIFRVPRNRLNGHILIVQDDIQKHFEQANNLSQNAPYFYKGILKTAIDFGSVPDLNFQNAVSVFFDEGQDLALPAITFLDKLETPKINGVALFSGSKFTHQYLSIDQSKMLVLLSKISTSKYLQLTYEYEVNHKKYPIVIEYVSNKQNVEIGRDNISHTIDLKVSVEEFSYDHLRNPKILEEVNQFLSKEVTNDLQEMVKILQDVKSDAIGYGKRVRAFHPELWKKGVWQETFSEIDITLKAKVEIVRTGILD